jgi:hypothetical protein
VGHAVGVCNLLLGRLSLIASIPHLYLFGHVLLSHHQSANTCHHQKVGHDQHQQQGKHYPPHKEQQTVGKPVFILRFAQNHHGSDVLHGHLDAVVEYCERVWGEWAQGGVVDGHLD